MLCKNSKPQISRTTPTATQTPSKTRIAGITCFAKLLALCCGASCALSVVDAATLNFQLLTWNDAAATEALPSAVGLKPSAGSGDWLLFTSDDNVLPAGNNQLGGLSHNLVDPPGVAGPNGFALAPSLSGSLTLELEPASGANWTATVKALAYNGQASAMMAMNQFLVGPDSPATDNDLFNVDGLGNSGSWQASASANWSIEYEIDFYFATNADGDPSPDDIDATFNDKKQTGHLIPVNRLTADGLSDVALTGATGFYSGDLKEYLLTQIAPRLPGNATYLLLTQMEKTHPDYAETGLPISTGGLVGNITFAYSTQTLAALPNILSLRFEESQPVIQFTGSAAQAYQIQRSSDLISWDTITTPTFTYPTSETVEWTDATPAPGQQFYRVIALTP